jgi:hypothetical protein
MDEPLVFQLSCQWHGWVAKFGCNNRRMHISVKYSSRLDLPTLKGNEGHRKTICLIGTECKVSNGFSLRVLIARSA